MTLIKIIIPVLLSISVNLCFAQTDKKQHTLDSLLTSLYQQGQFNGSILIAEKGEIIYKKGIGYSNEKTKSLNTANTIFELASCSKQFTGVGIVLLKKQGKLNYNDKISKYLPELSFWGDITIYNLLRHTSGIPEYLADIQTNWNQAKIAENEDIIRMYAKLKDTLEFKPNTAHRYCNTNYALLASIIERVSGKSYGDYLAENIFKPLNMTRTSVYCRRLHPKKVNDYAIGYIWAKNSFEKVVPEDDKSGEKIVYYSDGIVGESKVDSTINDLYKWIKALQNNILVSQNDFNEIMEVTTTEDGKKIPYGFGFDVSKRDGKFSYGHTGSWDGYTTFIYHDVIKDRTIIVLNNFVYGVYPYDNIKEILEDQPLSPVFKKKIKLSDLELIKYAGQYVDAKDTSEKHVITVLNGHLFYKLYNKGEISWDMRFFPVAPNEFQAIMKGGVDGVLKFTTPENGKIKLEMFQYGQLIGSVEKI